jgi:farnesyl-diphosphate farnesyltransferase
MPGARSHFSRSDVSVRELRGPILRAVSRSFYISIRLLPKRLREPVGLAYLLARSTDTVADTTQIPALVRAERLADLSSIIQGDVSPDALADLIDSFSPLQANAAERHLIESLPNSLHELARLSADDRNDVRTVLQKITKGQALDVARFGDTAEPHALATDLELHEYTYLVAGCVGEFWTRLCFRHIRHFSDLPEIEMAELGKRYGNSLQLINILRDAASDLQAGRCYFPIQELEEVGIDPSHILLEPARFEFILEKWREEAQRGLVAGMSYVRAIRKWRLRGATALPALIGARTLSLLRAAGATELHRTIKVSRSEVRAMIARLAITLGARESIQRMFQRYSGR